MRGKVVAGFPFSCQSGITPAYAGKSATCIYHIFRQEDHPRLCGEKGKISGSLSTPAGSPPPMRGKGSKPKICLASTGITPAYAGKSAGILKIKNLIEDHPRLCGEKPHTILADRLSVGSPPPMRGKVHQLYSMHAIPRITPAYAGKSTCCFSCGNYS